MTDSVELRFAAGELAGEVSGLPAPADGARLLYVLAHGAGAGMRHPFLESISQRLRRAEYRDSAVSFPYMEQRAAGPIRRPWPPQRRGGGDGGGPRRAGTAAVAAASRLAGG